MRRSLLAMMFALACGSAPEGSPDVTTEASSSTASTTSTATTASDATGEPTPTEADTTGAPAIACDPDPDPLPEDQFIAVLADSICAQKATCGCTVDFDCATPFAGQLTVLQDYATAHGFIYDGVCAARLNNARVQHPGCVLASALYDDPCDPGDCPIYRSPAKLGEPCEYPEDSETSFALVRLAPPCPDPLSCNDGVCGETPELPTVADGQPCFDPNIGTVAECMRGSGCDFGGTRTCQPLLGEGAPCPAGTACDYSLFCSADEICTPRLPAGAACTDLLECEAFRCPAGKCVDDTWICGVAELDDLFFSSPDIL